MNELPIVHDLDLVETAIAFAVLGWHVVPFKPDRSGAFVRYKNEPTPSHSAAAELFKRFSHSLLTVRLPQTVVVLDLDPRDRALLVIRRELNDQFGLPPCPVVATPRGGEHLWFTLPDGVQAKNWTSGLGRFPVANVDIRTNGGLAALPPSVRADGSYVWKRWMPVIPDAPKSLIEALMPSQSEPRTIGRVRNFTGGSLTPYARAALESELRSVANAPRGSRNLALFKASARLGELVAAGAMPARPVLASLESAAKASGLVSEGRSAVLDTIRSGWRRGLERPRQLPPGAA